MSFLRSIEPAIMGERLKAARIRAGRTQEDVASEINVARTTLVAIEKGERSVKADELRKLAALYDVDVQEIVIGKLDADLSPKFRQSLSSYTRVASVDFASRRLAKFIRAELKLEGLLGQILPQNFPAVMPLRSGSIAPIAEDAASIFRSRYGLGLGPIGDLFGLAQHEIGVRIYFHKLEARISGLYSFGDEYGAAILLNAVHPYPRRLMSLAHELGHFICNRTESDIDADDVDGDDREERFANLFAINLLMPATEVRRMFNFYVVDGGKFSTRHLVMLAEYFSVSAEAAGRRLEQLTLLKAGTYEMLRDRGLVKKAQELIGKSNRGLQITRLDYLAAECYASSLISEGQLANLLDFDRIQVRMMLDNFDVVRPDASEPNE